jgi:hypothetical protein
MEKIKVTDERRQRGQCPQCGKSDVRLKILFEYGVCEECKELQLLDKKEK